MKKFTILALLITSIGLSQTNLGAQFFINELDADQEGTDTLEFIEIKSTPANTSLQGLIVVLFNGNHTENGSYNVINLEGFTTDNNGMLLIGDDAVPGVDITLGASNKIQNGPDAVALYMGIPADFPNGTPPTTTNLVHALVYAKGEPDDVDLLLALNETVQYNEDLNSNSELESLQRREDGSFCTALPTLDLENTCADCNFEILATNSTCTSYTSEVDKTTVTLDFQGGGTEIFTTTLTEGTGIIGGDDPTSNASGTIIISEVDENSMIVVTITSANCNIDTPITAVSCDPVSEVATLAELRNGSLGETYTLTGEVILTFQQNFRNQKFIEDTTAAILLDDPTGIITTSYEIRNGITGITGVLNDFNGQLQFFPTSDPGVASSLDNSIIPQAVTMDALNASPEVYESEYVQIVEGVEIDTAINSTWIADQIYGMSNPNGTFNFRTSFYEVDYLGLTVPPHNVNIAGIITDRNSTYYLTSRNLNDVHGIILNTKEINLPTPILYPNPTQGDYVYIVSKIPAIITVLVYNTYGQLLLHTTAENPIHISSLSQGIYLLKITQDNLVTTKKLIVNK